MATKNIQLLLKENVENLGIVGDVVNVRLGYARNYLLPRDLAMAPSQDAIDALAEKRKAAEAELARLRGEREAMVEKLQGFELTLERSCNDQGVLYGAVTQQDIAKSLNENPEFQIRPRDVRIAQGIKRIDTYEVSIRPEADLEATIKVWVVADRTIEEDEREEMEFDNEGNLIERAPEPKKEDEPKEGEDADADKPAEANA